MYRLSYQDGDSPQTHTFSSGEVVIGRSPDCQVVLKDFGISRQHARIVVDDEGVRIQDLKSKNGTQVNGVPVVEAPLKDGDRILLGKFQLAFSKTLEGKVVLDEAKPLSEEAGTIIRSVGATGLKSFKNSGGHPPQPSRRSRTRAPAPAKRSSIVRWRSSSGFGPAHEYIDT